MPFSATSSLVAALFVGVLAVGAPAPAVAGGPAGNGNGKTPSASADKATTPANVTVVLPLLANDVATDAALLPGSVSLDPGSGYPTNVVVTPQGTFAVDPSGVLSFTPAPHFRGTARLQYCVSDEAGRVSAPTDISIGIGLSGLAAQR